MSHHAFMTAVHPMTQKANLRRMLELDRVLTTAQLERRGLLQAADWLKLPRITYTCRTRVTQPDSGVDLTFVALDEEWLRNTPRELMHWAALGEARAGVLRLGFLDSYQWQHVELSGGRRTHLPDAELIGRADFNHNDCSVKFDNDSSVEFDAGYSPAKVERKMEAAAEAGYRLLIWATSIHSRTVTVSDQARRLHNLGLLPGVDGVIVLFVDFWSVKDPYMDRPRCHKPIRELVVFNGPALVRGAGGRVRN
jgi:hypothetical protein